MEKKNKLWLVVGIVVTVLVVAGISYAYWLNVFVQNDDNVVITDCFKMSFEEDSNSNITLEQGYPLSDMEGSKLKPYRFSIQNICTSTNAYQINIESMQESTMPDRVIKAKLNESSGILLRSEVEPIIGEHAYLLEEGIIYPNETKQYELRIWMDESTTMADTDAMNKEFIGKITISASYTKTEYKDYILNGVDPVLKDGLIPVTIDNDGKVHKADTTTPWYSYENKVWANAVILNDESIEYRNNEEIPESNIESYFVWVPRYRYKIFNEGNYSTQNGTLLDNALPSKAQEIEVVFETKNNNISHGNTIGNWLTHPAFTSLDVNGLWVGKFETGYKGSSDKTSAESNTNEPNKVQIKPNVNSWRGIQVANAFYSSYDYKRELDSHMMKNTEWGAVAYLQHSKYGSANSVRINNNEDYVTGYSAAKEPTCGFTGINEECNRYGITEDITKPWSTGVGYLASTTGNISGVYDMSGGSFEFVMGVMIDKSGNPMSGKNNLYNSGFNGTFGCPTCDGDISGLVELTTEVDFPNPRYYDQYVYAENTEMYNRRILGDATGEMGPFATATYGTLNRQIGSWYADEAWFVYFGSPWLLRGELFAYGSDTGIFSFGNSSGALGSNISFRVVLSI